MRPMVCYARKNLIKEKLTACEIGVKEGENAKDMMECLPIKRFYLIDIDIKQICVESKETEIIKLKGDSTKIFNQITEPLDFVYIDGNHKKEIVEQDIKNFYPKTTWLIGGHDHNTGWNGVDRAVNDFVKEKKITLFVSSPDWWIDKTFSI